MNKFILLLAAVTLPFFISAQQKIRVVQLIQNCSKGEQNAYQTIIPQATLKDVEKDWKTYIKAKSKGKVEERSGEIFIYGAVNKNIAPEGFNLFSTLLETTEGVLLTAWFMRADSVFMSRETAPDKTLAAEKYLYDFAIIEYKAAVKNELNAENKKLAALESDLKQLINDEEKASKKINENERSISRTRTEIRTNENDQRLKKDQITKQKATVESLKSTPGDAQKAAEKTLKGLENELKKLVNENERLHKQIDKAEKEIREEQRNVDRSKQDQYLKRSDIDRQKTVCKSVADKLSNIK
ncbi:MAG: hypothetical protein KIS94_11120 [Chitinophagales bacterium]|nr:hypothetical protein [Chitinophagales bacterium]